jgi:hypothetical protein
MYLGGLIFYVGRYLFILRLALKVVTNSGCFELRTQVCRRTECGLHRLERTTTVMSLSDIDTRIHILLNLQHPVLRVGRDS